MMNLKTLAVFAALALVPAGVAHAQHKHGHSHPEKGKHGGQIVDAGAYHVELVAKGDAVEIYVSDEGNKPVAIAGYKGIAILSVGGKSQRIVLEAGDGRLTGKASADLPAQPKGVVQLTPPGGKTVSAKF
jgi:hypothetical protein